MVFKFSDTKVFPGFVRWVYVMVLLLLLAGLTVLYVFPPAVLLKIVGLGAEAAKIQRKFLTPARWQLIQAVLAGLCVTWIGLGITLKHVSGKVSVGLAIWNQGISEVNTAIKSLFAQFSNAPIVFKTALFVLFWAQSIGQLYAAARFPLTYDEIWTYLNFTRRGPLVALTYYPAPNNHVLYSLLSSFTVQLHPDSALFQRIPTLLASIATFWLLLVLLLRHSTFRWAVFGMFIFYSNYIIFYYGFQARGYEIQLLAFIAGLGAILELRSLDTQYHNAAWITFGASSILGLITIPTYVYPLFSLILLLGLGLFDNNNRGKITLLKRAAVIVVVVFSTTSIFYLPILVISGPHSFFANRFVTPIQRDDVIQRLPIHIRDTADWFFTSNFSEYLILILLAVAVTATVFKVRWFGRKVMLQLAFFLALPVVFMLVQSVIPFPRTWIYLIVVIMVLVCWLLSHLSDSHLSHLKLINGLLIFAICYWSLNTYLNTVRYFHEFGNTWHMKVP